MKWEKLPLEFRNGVTDIIKELSKVNINNVHRYPITSVININKNEGKIFFTLIEKIERFTRVVEKEFFTLEINPDETIIETHTNKLNKKTTIREPKIETKKLKNDNLDLLKKTILTKTEQAYKTILAFHPLVFSGEPINAPEKFRNYIKNFEKELSSKQLEFTLKNEDYRLVLLKLRSHSSLSVSIYKKPKNWIPDYSFNSEFVEYDDKKLIWKCILTSDGDAVKKKDKLSLINYYPVHQKNNQDVINQIENSIIELDNDRQEVKKAKKKVKTIS